MNKPISIVVCRSASTATLGLLLSGASLAQSSVNISGYLDMGIYRDTSEKWNVGSIQRSNIAFSGSEDLGNGVSATFKLSHRMDMDTGASEGVGAKPFWHGESSIGLKGPFGSLKFGRALDAMYNNDWQFDPWYYFNRISSPAWDLWHYNFPSDPQANTGSADYGRLNNGIFYDSPTFNGLAVHLSFSPELRTGDLNRPLGTSLTYSEGGYAAMIAHEKNSAGNTDTFVGLKGNFGGLGVMGAYDISKAGASTAKTKTFGVQYIVGQTTFNGGWGKADVGGVKVEEVLGAGAVYVLSKRTSVYADLASKRFPGNIKTTYGTGFSHSF